MFAENRCKIIKKSNKLVFLLLYFMLNIPNIIFCGIRTTFIKKKIAIFANIENL